jgi:hypothetical protein
MLEELIAYRKTLDQLLHDNPEGTDWKRETKLFHTKFLHLQIERLIHLLVTLTVGLAALISCLATMAYPMVPLYVLDAILMILFLAYILHYRKLENTAQSWYVLFDTLKEKTDKNPPSTTKK